VALYKVQIKSSAGKELLAVGSKADRQRLVGKIQSLADNPRPHGSEKLAGFGHLYRVRQGNYRVVYQIDDAAKEVTVYKIGDRKDIYR
jgi:mRNA interferase RelE/StbE